MNSKHDPRLSELITTPEVAELAGVGENTVSMWRKRGVGPAYHHIGRYVVYQRSEVERWIREEHNPIGGAGMHKPKGQTR